MYIGKRGERKIVTRTLAIKVPMEKNSDALGQLKMGTTVGYCKYQFGDVFTHSTDLGCGLL